MARVLIFLILSRALFAAGFLWPLPDSKTLTGGFADSRPDHFHGGVDLRARSPLKVVAPTDGWVERISINPGGYGRTLYYRLSDGHTAVFGHLSRYEPGLQETVRDSQLVRGTYRVEFSFDDSTTAPHFKAGDVLCYTGSSGRGPAHLHYEIRDGAVQIDPLSFYSPRDHDKPVITGVSWVRLSENIPMSGGHDLVLSASPRVQSTEPVAFLVRAYDPGPWGRNSVPRAIRVFEDERLIFEDYCGEIDLFGPADIYEKLVYYDYKARDRDVRRLYKWPEYDLSTTANLPQGWIEDFVGVVRIEVEDRNGNTASVRLPVEAGDQRLPRPETECATSVYSFAGDPVSQTWAKVCGVGDECRINDEDFAFASRQVLTAPVAFEIGKFFYKRSGAADRSPVWRIPAENSGKMSCYVLRGGTYGIGTDMTPPVLSLSGKSGKLTFKLTDGESSIDDNSIRCKVDGVVAIPEFEFEEKGGAIWTQSKLRSGKHRVEFEAANRAGVIKSWDQTVTIP